MRRWKQISRSRLGKGFSSGGFTVIETLIAMLLLAFSLAGGIAVYFNASQLKSMAVHKEIATEIASSALEELRRQGCQNFANDHGSSTPTATVQNFNDDDPPTIGGAATTSWEITPVVNYDYDNPPGGGVIPTDYRLVTVTVSWQEPSQGSPREISATSYVAP